MTLIRLVAVIAFSALATACKGSEVTTDREPVPPGNSVVSTALAVTVDGTGYHPASISAPAGGPVRLTITRTSDEGCGQQIVFPSLSIRRDLPLNRTVSVEFTMPASGNVAFTCGMDMLRGSIVAR